MPENLTKGGRWGFHRTSYFDRNWGKTWTASTPDEPVKTTAQGDKGLIDSKATKHKIKRWALERKQNTLWFYLQIGNWNQSTNNGSEAIIPLSKRGYAVEAELLVVIVDEGVIWWRFTVYSSVSNLKSRKKPIGNTQALIDEKYPLMRCNSAITTHTGYGKIVSSARSMAWTRSSWPENFVKTSKHEQWEQYKTTS